MEDWKDIYDDGDFFTEAMDHVVEIKHQVSEGLVNMVKKLKLPFVVPNNSHYTHGVLLCVHTGKPLLAAGSTA